jgi:hypothetical protein
MKDFTDREQSFSLESQAGDAKEWIDATLQRSNVRITGPMRRHPISQRREPGSHCPPALRMRLSWSRGHSTVIQPPSAPNSTGPILDGTG